MDSQQVAGMLVEALALLHRAKGYVNKYPSIGAQELSKDLAEFLAEFAAEFAELPGDNDDA